MLDWMRRDLLGGEFISSEDVDLVSVTSDPAEAVRIVVDCYEQRCAESPAAPEKADAQ